MLSIANEILYVYDYSHLSVSDPGEGHSGFGNAEEVCVLLNVSHSKDSHYPGFQSTCRSFEAKKLQCIA